MATKFVLKKGTWMMPQSSDIYKPEAVVQKLRKQESVTLKMMTIERQKRRGNAGLGLSRE